LALVDKIGKFSFRAANAGLLVAANALAERMLPSDQFGRVYIMLSLTSILIGTFDYYNQKYLIFIYSNSGIGRNLSILLVVKLLLIFEVLFILLFLGLEFQGILVGNLLLYVCIGIFVVFSILSQSLSTYIFCTERARHLLYCNIASAIFMVMYFIYIFSTNSIDILFLVVGLIVFRGIEFLYYLIYLGFGRERLLFLPKWAEIYKFIKSNSRGAYYIQWLLSLVSSRISAILLPLYLVYEEIAIYGKFSILVSLMYFWISFSGSTFFSEVCKRGVSHNLLKKTFIEIMIYIFVFWIIELVAIVYLYHDLVEYSFLIAAIIFLISFTSYQGYFLFYYGLDRLIVRMSLFTILLSYPVYIILINYYGLYGAFSANIIIESIGFIMALIAVLKKRRKQV